MVVSMAAIEQTSMNPLAATVRAALLRAIARDGALPEPLLAMEGMSGQKYRLFINNLIAALDDARYLEVGTWMGSTLCSAIYGNRVRALAIDNWSEFGAPAPQFFANLSNFKTPEARVSFLDTDFRAVDFGTQGRYNVYLFDGPHQENDQRDGVLLAQPALDRYHVLIVDDWNWPSVRKGTMEAIKEAGLVIDHLVEIRTTCDDQHPPVSGSQSDWHNGYFIAAVTKPA